MENFYALIMAGGGGTRLWPLSRRRRPKQLLTLVGEDSMFRQTITRLLPLLPPARIFVVTGQDQVADLQAEAPEVPADNFIVEPFGRDSGPAAALGLAHIAQLDANAVIAILTADHYIRDTERFLEVLRAAHQVAGQGYIVTLSIKPTYPATGFGYLHQGEEMQQAGPLTVYHSLGFKEKPQLDVAQQFLADGAYGWNSGMFICQAQSVLQEFARQQPAMYQHLQRIGQAFGTDAYQETIAQVWAQMPKLSLDFAVMEQARQMAIIPVDIGWSDIGNWGAVYEELATADAESIAMADTHHINIESRGILVHSKRPVVTIGVEDLVIIDTDDAILICHRDSAQDVKKAVDHFKENALDNLL